MGKKEKTNSRYSPYSGLVGVFTCPIVYEKHQVRPGFPRKRSLLDFRDLSLNISADEQFPAVTDDRNDFSLNMTFRKQCLEPVNGFLLSHQIFSSASVCVPGSDRSLRGSGQQPNQRRRWKVGFGFVLCA